MKEWLMEMAEYYRSISTTDPYYIERANHYQNAARFYNPHPNLGSTNVNRGRPGARMMKEWRDKNVNHV